MASYDTDQERSDIHTLNLLGYNVENPNSPKHKKIVNDMRSKGKDSSQIMNYFCQVVEGCDGLAFRGLPDGSLPAGVAKEIEVMKRVGEPIIELPEFGERKTLTVRATRQYIGRMKWSK